MTILIAGLGNPLLSDDGVGCMIAQKIKDRLGNSDPSIVTEAYSLAGLALMEQMVDYDYVIIIDSLYSGQMLPGNVSTFTLDQMEDLTNGHSASAHDLSLKKALIFGRSMNVKLPEDKNIFLVAIEARHVYEFGETFSPEIEAAIPVASEAVFRILNTIN